MLRRIETAINEKLEFTSCERYWKDSSLFEVSFTSGLNTDDVAHAVFKTLMIAKHISPHWNITTPTKYDDDLWEFTGLSTETKITGVEWIEFFIVNQ